MSEHRARIEWQRKTDSFAYADYLREHAWGFPGGLQLRASAAPEYFGDKTLPNPEEAFVAALSSCHMLTFLAICSKRQFIVDSYEDSAVGFLEKNADGKLCIVRAVLRPKVVFGGDRAKAESELAQLHHRAHEGCFIANSVTTDVTIEPQ